MVTVGIVGASGFVGSRIVEILHDKGIAVRPIARRADSLETFSRIGLNSYVANAFDQSALREAFAGCDVVVHSVLGSPGLIRGSVRPMYQAAQQSGVRRIIYLSSMIVHTSAPAEGTTEATPPVRHQPRFPTHIAKVDAEERLLKMRQTGDVEVVIFRPGIVFGPRSRWVVELTNQLQNGTAYFINDGSGICNTVYIDNLVHAIHLSLEKPGIDGEAFFVGDQEKVTWRDFYQPFANELGINLQDIPQLFPPSFSHSQQKEWIRAIQESETIQRSLALIPDGTKKYLKKIFKKPSLSSAERSLAPVESSPTPVITEMMSVLQQSSYKLPLNKAKDMLGYEPIVSFNDGCQRSIKWLKGVNQLACMS
ncbi:NAD(P)-dependent oxidoreductase [Nodosilinea sp. LEGE 07088]|uniref:NAD-dependent epimerase/dehydratase family protein n=1 Tax=Nodosilinea sp. LEGE 07088 TaxID=2777968 RepID=UPI00187F1089|nr:NAD(P)-dependent oxidoreductase [Nodosilinea sp. LEGE 07088]MBE9135871.1 NAD(P)-dependent oxidoreductase [Nodosilinea sp. LEGE 07088]